MAALPQILPAELADYHISRARCSQAAKRARRKLKRKAQSEEEGMDVDGDGDGKSKDDGPSASTGGAPANADAADIPPRPEILDHLVLGLNETIRELERSIDDLRLRMALLAEGVDPSLPRLLPTAPSPAPEPSPAAAPSASALTYLLVPHTSVSPLSLIDPLPTYCATYNTLLRQASDLARGVRLPGGTPADADGAFDAPEIQIVPLGKREADIAAAAGLRRVTSVGVRASHPAVGVLERLVPKSVLRPPRHSMTLPWPTMRLKVHADASAASGAASGPTNAGIGEKGEEGEKSAGEVNGEGTAKPSVTSTNGTTQPATAQPAIAYAPLHIKALHTTAPLDPNARKTKRLAEVRQKRVEAKAHRLARRKEVERKVRADLLSAVGGGAKGAGKKFGRAERLAAKAAKTAKAQ